MKNVGFLFCVSLSILATTSHANMIVHYQGLAKNGDRLAYIEKHTVEYDDQGKLLSTATEYTSAAGKSIAELRSDFRESLAVPSQTFKDFRTGNVEGVRRDRGKLVMFDQDPGKLERTRSLDDSDLGIHILVGGQGMNYYLLDHLETIQPLQELSLRFLIPGKLDFYDFKIKKTNESTDGIVEFEIVIQNWFFKIFAPKLFVKYDKKKKRIVWYKGISNLKSDDGSKQNVTITYEYE